MGGGGAVFCVFGNCLSTELTIDWAMVRPVGVAGLVGGGFEATVALDAKGDEMVRGEDGAGVLRGVPFGLGSEKSG